MSAHDPALLGRSVEVTALTTAVNAGLTGRGRPLVLVQGEPGIGKTRVVAVLAEEGSVDAVVCRGTALPGGAETPLLPWADALRQAVATYGVAAATNAAGPALAQLGVLLPDLEPQGTFETDRPAGEGRAADVLPWFVGRLAALRPLVVVLEDVHLADQATLTTLGRLADQTPPAVVVVATARAGRGLDPVSPAWLEAAVGLRRLATCVDLAPLSPVDAAELVARRAAAAGVTLDDASIGELVDRAEGNPFFAEELVAVRASGRGTVPPAEVLGVRLSMLSSQALAVAEAVAVHGAGAPHGVLRELAALDEPDLLTGLRELVAADLVVELPAGVDGEEGYAFRHGLVGEAVSDRMLPVERRRLHAACARSVESRLPGADPATRRRLLGELAAHWSRAGRVDLALPVTVSAAEACAAVAPDVAAAHYRRALDLAERMGDAATGPSRPVLLELLAEQQGAAGDGAAAAAAARASLDLLAASADFDSAGLGQAARLHRLIAVHGEGVLTDAEVLAAYAAAVAAAERLGPSPELAAALAAQARHELVLDHNARSVPLSRRAREIAVAVGAESEEAMAAATLGASLCYLGQFEEGLQTLGYAVPALESTQRGYDAARALLTLVWAQFHGGDPLGGLAGAERAAEAMRRGGGPRDVALRLEAAALEMAVACGRWDEVALRLERWDPAGAGDPAGTVASVEAALLRSVRAEHALRHGEPVVGQVASSAVLAYWERLGLRAYDSASLGRLAEEAADRGSFSQARAYLVEGLNTVEAADTWVAVLAYARAGLGVEAAAARSGRPVDGDLVERYTALMERSAGGTPAGSVAAAEHTTATAELARVGGREDPDAWRAAVAAWARLGFPWWRAAAELRQAAALVARRGARREAATLVADAVATAELLGAGGLLRAADDLARRAGLDLPLRGQGEGRPGAGGEAGGTGSPELLAGRSAVGGNKLPAQRSSAEDPLAALSAREREVVMLLSSGASNRRIAEQLFISEKTASVHVSHILAKLGVSSRLEAAAVVHGAR